MGCKSYHLANGVRVRFSEGDDDLGCLCTFPHNDGGELSGERVRSLAYLGAMVALSREPMTGFSMSTAYLPNALPEWIRREIDRITAGATLQTEVTPK